MPFKYYLLNRPPEEGAYPPNPQGRASWIPTQLIPPGEIELYARHAHGYVVYEQPLLFEQVYSNELEPDPEVLKLWLAYHYWLDGSKRITEAEFLIRDAWDCAPEQLNDFVDKALLVYKDQDGGLGELLAALKQGAGDEG